jgi:oligopeptide/dipeptide ABC transporter ATP-binding protein
MAEPLLSVRNLTTVFQTGKGVVKAVDDVSFDLGRSEVLGIVGESGSGKSVTALSILGLLQTPPGRIAGGQVLFEGQDLLKLSESRMERIRGSDISMIFQEPMTSLNPVFSVGDQIMETIRIHEKLGPKATRDRAIEMLEKVGIPSPERRIDDYPHQLSGGMRQRVMIAMALACSPKLLLADEPTTALDVTIQAQILDLLRSLRQRMGLALLLITHDLGVVAEMADRVAVMYSGRIVEEAPVRTLFADPKHPYTRGLMASIPGGAPGTRLRAIQGTVPPLGELPPGCSFTPRCPNRFEPCARAFPGTTVFTDLPPEGGSHATPVEKDSRGFRLQAEGRHTTRCYLYSDAVDPDVRTAGRS